MFNDGPILPRIRVYEREEFYKTRCHSSTLKRKRSIHKNDIFVPQRICSDNDAEEKIRKYVKIHEDEAIRKALQEFEVEMMCPICTEVMYARIINAQKLRCIDRSYGISAASHTANPCGHSYCGACIEHWITRCELLVQLPVCPLCRALFDLDVPVIPSIALDSIIEKHICALGKRDAVEWQSGGERFLDWSERKQTRADDVARRMTVEQQVPQVHADNAADRIMELQGVNRAPAIGPDEQTESYEEEESGSGESEDDDEDEDDEDEEDEGDEYEDLEAHENDLHHDRVLLLNRMEQLYDNQRRILDQMSRIQTAQLEAEFEVSRTRAEQLSQQLGLRHRQGLE